MRIGLGLAIANSASGASASALTIEITTLPTTLYVGASATIAGTTTAADGETVTVTVKGESFGSATASGGAWSVTATPTEAMVGASVNVVATAGSATDTETVEVFAPSSTPGLALNLDSDLGVTADADRVSLWEDQSPSGTDVAQATAANQPLWNGAGGGISFDGGNDFLLSNVALSSLRYLHSECTVFVALDMTTTDTGRALVYTAPASAANIGLNLRTGAASEAVRLLVNNGTGTSAVDQELSTGSFGTGKYVLAAGVDGTGSVLRSNSDGGTAALSESLADSTDPTNQLAIFPFVVEATMYQILAYNRKLSVAEIAKVEAYLSDRWGIPFS